jgi:catechol 2,3-dioxygenase-like lactoylglutathione lyase family enzyme
MAEAPTIPCVTGLVPMAPVADVQRAADFYKQLGMEMRNHLKNPVEQLQWAWLENRGAQLMLTRTSEPVVPDKQAVLFYLYSPDLVALREHLLANGVKVSKIAYPEYMEKGEICLADVDGYCLLIGQAG